MNVERTRARASVAGLTVLAFVLAHEVTFLASYGEEWGAGLARSGHGQGWAITVLTVAAGAAVLTILALAGLIRLSRQTAGIKAAGAHGAQDTSLLRSWPSLTAIILPGALLLFGAEENLSHAAAGLGLPGLDVLSDHPSAPLVFLGVSILVAFVGALYRRQRSHIEARLAAGSAPRPGCRIRRGRRPGDATVPVASLAGRHMALRGPPLPLYRGRARRA